MVQQQVDNAWQHMVGVICLNQTGRKKVKQVLNIVSEINPDAYVTTEPTNPTKLTGNRK